MSSPSYDWIAHHALVRGDKLAVHDLDSGRKFTYTEMNERTSRLATALRSEFNIDRGDRVAVLAENDSNTLDCLLYTSPSPRDVEESRMPSSA